MKSEIRSIKKDNTNYALKLQRMRHFKRSLVDSRAKSYIVLTERSKADDVEEKVRDDTMVVQDISTSHL